MLTKTKMQEIQDLKPVSYTHLDVYKRQIRKYKAYISFFHMVKFLSDKMCIRDRSNPVQNGPLYKIARFLRKLVNPDCFSDSSLKSISFLPSVEPVRKPPHQKEFPRLHPDTGTDIVKIS